MRGSTPDVVAALRDWLAVDGRARAAGRGDLRLDRAPQAGGAARAARSWPPRTRHATSGSAARGRWLLTLPASYVAGLQVVVPLAGRRATSPRCSRSTAPSPTRPRRGCRDVRSSRWCPPSCTGCSTTPARPPRCAASTPCCSAAARSTRRCGPGPRRRACGWSRRTAPRRPRRLRVRRLPARRRRARDRRATARIRIARPDALRRLRGRPGADRRDAGGRLVPHLRRRPARRGRPAARARPRSTTWWSAAASTCRPPRSPRGCASTPASPPPRCSASPTRSGATGWSPSWCVGAALRWSEAARLGRRRAPALVGAARSWSSLDALPLLDNGKPDRLRLRRAGRRVTAMTRVWSIPLRTRFRGITVREGVLLARRRGRAGASGARSWSTTPPVAEPWLRCAEEAAAGDWPAPVRDAGARSTSPCPPSAPSGRTRSCSPAAARTAKVKVAEPGQTLGRRPGPGRGGPRRARPGGRVRVDANGGWDVDDGGRARSGCWTGPPAGWSTSSSRARASRSWPRYAARSTCRSPPTSRSAGPRTPTGSATSRPPTSPCSRCSRWAGCAPACGSPRTSGCRSSSRQRAGDLGRDRGRGRAGGRAARAALRLRAGDRAAAHRRRGRRRRCCRSTGAAGRRCRSSTPRALDRLAADPGAGRALGGPAGRGASAGAAAGSPLVTHRLRPRWPAPSSTALVEAGVARGRARARAPATPRCRSRRTTPPRPGGSGCTPASTSAPPASSPSA